MTSLVPSGVHDVRLSALAQCGLQQHISVHVPQYWRGCSHHGQSRSYIQHAQETVISWLLHTVVGGSWDIVAVNRLVSISLAFLALHWAVLSVASGLLGVYWGS